LNDKHIRIVIEGTSKLTGVDSVFHLVTNLSRGRTDSRSLFTSSLRRAN